MLQDTLTRLSGKASLLLQKYEALSAEKRAADLRLSSLEDENLKLRKELSQLKADNENLRVARTVASSPEELAQSKAMISQLVRDIDKCIAQLTE